MREATAGENVEEEIEGGGGAGEEEKKEEILYYMESNLDAIFEDFNYRLATRL